VSYISVTNFWEYQNSDVWKKCKGHPPWFKHYVHRDRELDKLSLGARLLFWELLAAATRYQNVLEADLSWICSETRMAPEVVAESLPVLVKGGWLSQTKSKRRSREPSRKNLDGSRDLGRGEGDKAFLQGRTVASPPTDYLPSNYKDELILNLLNAIATDADNGTPTVVGRYARQLPEASLAKVLESVANSKRRNKAEYVVGALKSECKERGIKL
jgi:hypothetical protein